MVERIADEALRIGEFSVRATLMQSI